MTSGYWARSAVIGLALVASSAAQANRYRIVDLGREFFPQAINDRGVIAGDHGISPARWRDGHMRLLTPSGWGSSLALNTRGQIAGWAEDPVGGTWPIVWSRPRSGNGRFLRLPQGAEFGYATAISNDGATAGDYSYPLGDTHCFIARDGFEAVEMGWGEGCTVGAMNDNGQVAGSVVKDSDRHGFLWQDSRFQILDGLPGDSNVSAAAINDRGDVVGHSWTADARGRALFWRQGVVQEVGRSGRYENTEATAINNHGVIVGRGLPPHDGHNEGHWVALRFEGPRAIVLSTEVEGLGDWRLTFAASVNNDGAIVGQGERFEADRNGVNQPVSHGFVLYPLDEETVKGEASAGS